MEISTYLLARAQFALSLNFHVLFAALALALAWSLCLLKYQAYRRPDSAWTGAYRFSVRVFALAFFMALASALPVLIELGILWPGLMERTGNVSGPIIACAITTLFVTKSVFLGVMLFGQRRVSPIAHLFSVCMVALGLTATVFWEIVLLSWSQAPAGAALVDGRFQVYEWFAVLFNPALIWNALLYLSGGFLAAGCLMLGVTAWQAARRPLEESERLTYRINVFLTCAAVALQLIALDGTARLNAKLRPVAAAAVMGYWHTDSVPEMVWLGWPVVQEQSTLAMISTETGATRWLGRNQQEELIGLDTESAARPAVMPLFLFARFAFFATLLILGQVLVTFVMMRRRGDQADKFPGWLLRAQVWMTWLGATVWLASWNLAQFSQAPFLVWGLLLQEDLLTSASATALTGGLVASALLYLILFVGFSQLLSHAARFGVVPVRKPGVRP